MVQTDTLTTPTQAIIDLLKQKWNTLGLSTPDDIYYGDEARYLRYPAIAVEPTSLQAEPTSTQMRMTNTFIIYVFVYEGSLKNQEVKRKDRDERAEAVRDRIHTDRTLGGILAHINVTNIEPGISIVAQEHVLASRLTLEGISKTEL